MKPSAILALSAVLALLIAGDALFAWTAPGAVPPSGNVAAPVHTGDASQIKIGGLGVGALDVAGGAIVRGTPEPADVDLTVTGRVGAREYCDENGQNCSSAAGGGGGGAWVPTDVVLHNGSITGSVGADTGGIDLNLSGIVGARETLVQLYVTTSQNTSNSFTFKPKGVAGVQGTTVGSGVGAGSASLQIQGSTNRIGYVTVTTNDQGIILMQSYATQNVEVRLVGYMGSAEPEVVPPGGTWGSWQNVAGSRAGRTWYQNTGTTGRMVNYQFGTGGPADAYVSPTGSNANWIRVTGPDGDSGEWKPGSFLVPPGHHYYIDASSGIRLWAELQLPW